MQYLLYKATSPSNRIYIGVTNNFKRRMKEHLSSKYPFGEALRKYGKHNFTYEFEQFDCVEDALLREAELVTEEQVKDKKYYNVAVGGGNTKMLLHNNPMHRKEVVESHPNLFSSEYNPMYISESKQKMIESQDRKQVSIDGVVYDGVRLAARSIGYSRQRLVHRLKSNNYPDWHYV